MKSQEERWLLAEKYNGVKTDEFFADCKALALGTPLGYLIGNVPFLDCTIHLDNQPLIPRVETEYWVELAIAVIIESQTNQPDLFQEGGGQTAIAEAPQRGCLERGQASQWQSAHRPTTQILDLCAGSGCIGVAVAHAVPASEIDFAELNQRLIPTIRTNCEANEISPDRYTAYHSNLFESIPIDTTYDFILSNPPYIDPSVDRAEESVKSHEPHLALYGGIGGLEIIEQLITAAPAYLAPGGQLWIEHEPEQSAAIKVIASEHNFAAVTHRDQYQAERYSILVYNLNYNESEARL